MKKTPKNKNQNQDQQEELAPIDSRESLYEWVETFVTALVAVVLVFTFLFRVVAVDGDSMNMTLHHRDTLVISRLTPAKAGDIVVFQNLESGYGSPLIKRIIATEGQTVDIDPESWTVTVDGVALDEPYVNYIAGTPMRTGLVQFPYTVEPGKVFVMGDNRNNSSDSRSFGAVDKRNIMGKVLIRLLPVTKFGIVKPATD